MARKFFVRTFGCQMNEHDSRRIASDLVADGLEPTDDLDDADVVVLNTCCIRENADNRLYGNLGRLKTLRARRPGMQIAVGGCLAQKDGAALVERAPFVDVVFGTHNVGRAAALLREAASGSGPVVEVPGAPASDADAFASALPVRDDLPHAAWVTIQVGCDNSCAFCIVPSVRGREQSRPLEEIVSEVAALARTGTVEVTLLGQNVNSYGRDITRRRPLFADVLRAVGSVEGIRRVRFTSPHPKDLRPVTVAAMAETPAVCEQLHLPLQSGSDAVLSAMRRGYTAERYLERISAARAAIPGLAVTTDVIVGFPGEGEEDFEATLEVVAEVGYDGAYTFEFSPRPGTRAAAMTDRFVPAEVVSERFARLTAVVERSALLRHEARVGTLEEVLVEGPSRRDPAMLTGRTRQGKLVHFAPGERAPRPGAFAGVEVRRAGPHHLLGDLVSVEQGPPAARRRIPVRVTAP
ncbi:MAG: tRNA (N6-isopentenyl adenosine(37)-C2)-methylthiotransferase MiaB [Actinomycetota bacterium]|nr:tRNA (N6-isopentenyl adenosine(37)-C2)-methylthiotransferase MiaB [Actinomycetota bacterium]